MSDFYIGIMSGTSMDAIDAVILDVNKVPAIIEYISIPFPKKLHSDISRLIYCQQTSLKDLGYVDIAMAELYTKAVEQLLVKAKIHPTQISAIGCHGQTICHQPKGKYRFSIQIGSGSFLAEKTSITTVTDFRNRDIAAGGQGAPLVPAFHKALFNDDNENRLVINIGGIANCTWLPSKGEIIGFDIGPGNTLMDSWIKRCCKKSYDKEGQWAAEGKISKPLLEKLMADEYFQKATPKSTGREYFNLRWLENSANTLIRTLEQADIQATLLELTACSIANIINHFQPEQTYFCGGGVHNLRLISRIKKLTSAKISDINELGIHPDLVEAAAFAWLAQRCLNHQTGTLSSVTGAKHPVISGAIYPV